MFYLDLSFFFYFYFILFYFLLIAITLALDYFLLLILFLDLLVLINILLFILYTLLSINPIGYCYALILLGVAAADTAVGLGLFLLYYKITNSVSILKG